MFIFFLSFNFKKFSFNLKFLFVITSEFCCVGTDDCLFAELLVDVLDILKLNFIFILSLSFSIFLFGYINLYEILLFNIK